MITTLIPRRISVLSTSGYRIVLIGLLTLHIGTEVLGSELLSFEEVFGAEDVCSQPKAQVGSGWLGFDQSLVKERRSSIFFVSGLFYP